MDTFTFADVFAGIGGFHLALHSLGGSCVYAAENDPFARKTYEHNFSILAPKLFRSKSFYTDVTLEEVKSAFPHNVDILCAGFPCQPFSLAGKQRGFHELRGTLFFDIVDITSRAHPKVLFLENVAHLLHHDKGNTFQIILDSLTTLGYRVFYKVLKACDYGLPTYRPRLYIIAFRGDLLPTPSFTFPPPVPALSITLDEIFGGRCSRKIGYTIRVGGRGSGLHDRRNWDTYLVDDREVTLTVDHAKKMMGFPKNFSFPVSPSRAMKQLGNSVAIAPVKTLASEILNTLYPSRTQFSTPQYPYALRA